MKAVIRIYNFLSWKLYVHIYSHIYECIQLLLLQTHYVIHTLFWIEIHILLLYKSLCMDGISNNKPKARSIVSCNIKSHGFTF